MKTALPAPTFEFHKYVSLIFFLSDYPDADRASFEVALELLYNFGRRSNTPFQAFVEGMRDEDWENVYNRSDGIIELLTG